MSKSATFQSSAQKTTAVGKCHLTHRQNHYCPSKATHLQRELTPRASHPGPYHIVPPDLTSKTVHAMFHLSMRTALSLMRGRFPYTPFQWLSFSNDLLQSLLPQNTFSYGWL
jgi:hypothetical protein